MKLRTSQYTTVTDTSQQFATAMQLGQSYRLASSVTAYFKVGATGGSASAAAGSHFIGAGQEVILEPHDSTNGFVQIVRIGASSGVATLSLIENK